MLLEKFTLRSFLRNYYHNPDAALSAASKSLAIYRRAENQHCEIVKSRIASLEGIIDQLKEMGAMPCSQHPPKQPNC